MLSPAWGRRRTDGVEATVEWGFVSTDPSGPAVAALREMMTLPGVTEAVESAREACTQLRWHQALRRRIPEAAAESRVRGATASAMLEGAEPAGSEHSVDLVRDLMRGAQDWQVGQEDPVWRVLAGSVRVTAATERVTLPQLRSPAQVLASLHTAAAAELLPADQVGRPRVSGEMSAEWSDLGPAPTPDEVRERWALVDTLIAALPGGQVPTLLVAAVAHAEIVVCRPFVLGNGLVARALERVLLRLGGLDPTGVAVSEVGHADRTGLDYRAALSGYAQGGTDGVALWLRHAGKAVNRAAAEGNRIADAVLAGRLH